MARHSPHRRIKDAILQCGTGVDLDTLPDVTVEPWMVDRLREAEAEVRQLRRQVEQRLYNGSSRYCVQCHRTFVGRPDKTYCSERCRQAAHRSRHAPKVTDLAVMAPSRRRT